MTVLLLMTPCMKGLGSSGLNMPPVCLTMCQSDIWRASGYNVIAMVKRSSKRNYIFEGKHMNIKKIFASCKKRRGRSKYLLSVPVKVGQDKTGKNGIDARIVCVRNRNKHKDWIAIICTDMSLSEQNIIRIYGPGILRYSSKLAKAVCYWEMNIMAFPMTALPYMLQWFLHATCY